MSKVEVTFLIPCLNEEETIGKCVKIAKKFLSDNNIEGEVLVVDNNSTDNSLEIAKKNGARVVSEKNKGYGSALITGTNLAKGKYVIMADADCSYDFSATMPFIEMLREGYDLVMGNRFRGKIEKDAMPFTHKYIGNPILSLIGKVLFRTKIGDFHCGLRGYNKDKMKMLNLKSPGMEYASEMVVLSCIKKYKIGEIPITLYKDERVSQTSHINSVRDGIRHLKLMLSIYMKRREYEK